MRPDWCDVSHEASDHFLYQIFHSQIANMEYAVGNILCYFSNLAFHVKNNEASLSSYVITRAVNKRPQDYPERHSTFYVAVAARMIKKEKRAIRPGDYITYVRQVDLMSSIMKPGLQPGYAYYSRNLQANTRLCAREFA